MEFLDPRAQLAVAPDVYDLGADLSGAPTIGLMANGFPGSVVFLDHVRTAISTRLPSAGFHAWNKGDASRLAGQEELDALAETCDAVIGAYGH